MTIPQDVGVDRRDAVDDGTAAAVSELRRRLLRYRADRHPVEHATAQFHLGATLLQAEQLPEATRALETAATLFEAQDRPVELAKATNMLGVAHRAAGERSLAAAAFQRAAALLERNERPAEEGAAHHNLGLLHRDAGDEREAADRFAVALERFEQADAAAQASAAARERGTSLLNLGDIDGAIGALARAEKLADRAGDLAALGGASNVRGLALLAAGRADEAVAAFEHAAGAHPRRLRPEGYAMAKANLALAAEQAGRPHLARLVARQASGTPAAPGPVTDQADAVLARLGMDPDDLHALLDDMPAEQWPAPLRDEAVRWADETDDERLADVGGWIDGQIARPATAEQRASTWLEILLEQPPRVFELVASAAMRALAERDPEQREAFRAPVRRAAARFGVPQLLRLEETFDRLAGKHGFSWR